MIEKLAEIARSQVGVKEVGGNNRGAKIREYQSSTNLAPAAWPWCSAFCCWAIEQWLKDKEVIKWLEFVNSYTVADAVTQSLSSSASALSVLGATGSSETRRT